MKTINNTNTLEKRFNLSLSPSCEVRYASCPSKAIEMRFWGGQFIPKINESKCKKYGLFLKLCRGFDIEEEVNKIGEDSLKAYFVYEKDDRILQNLNFVKILSKNQKGGGKINEGIKQIFIGKKYHLNRLNFALFLNKIENKSFRFYEIFLITFYLFISIIKNVSFNKKVTRDNSQENVILVGGNLFNKGAQAMVFTVVDQVKRVNPNLKVFLFSEKDFRRDEFEKKKYNFGIMPWSSKIKMNLLSDGKMFKDSFSDPTLEKKLIKIISNSKCFIDISGYALSSGFSTKSFPNFTRSLFYLVSIIVARKFSVSYYIFPQSIGPFNYSYPYKLILEPFLKICLKYPKKIFVREKFGFEAIKKYTKNNIWIKKDIVLSGNAYDLKNIFKDIVFFEEKQILDNSVGIIPNKKIFDRMDKKEFFLFYKSVIKELISLNKNIYILRHSEEDLSICLDLKKLFVNEKQVKIISEDLNCIQLENIISHFDFVVASRYHSIVHAYKKNVPVLCIGWAIKYKELLSFFLQDEYFFDVDKNLQQDKVLSILKVLARNINKEKDVIKKRREILLKDFDESLFVEIFK